MATQDVVEVIARIVARDPQRPEAQLQADIYSLLMMGALQLGPEDVAQLEVPMADGTKRRVDVQIGHCCIEVKKDLRPGNVLANARRQLAGYVEAQRQKFGVRYLGIITDGVSWHLHRLVDGELVEVTTFTATRSDPDGLLIWLESVLATQQQLPATPKEIRRRLGAGSPAHQVDHATLSDLYTRAASRPEVQLKKDLWAKLLRTAFGSAFTDSPDLFIDHTLLVLTAEAIAHAVVGFDLRSGDLSPHDIARGTKFHDAQIYGVVEEDFFDWVLDVEGGTEFVSDLARRVARFEWSTLLQHDILKALYTSVIPTGVREALGEYYTPDWLADRMVADVYTDPASQRLLEPACGSGTFLLHAVQAHLRAVEKSGMSAGQAVDSVTRHVIGMDVHPVAVILARVTYLMAIGRERLTDPSRGPVAVPVYLGDSVQWEQRADLFTGDGEITVSTEGDDLVEEVGGLWSRELRFPAAVLEDAANFDHLVTAMADKAVTTTRPAAEVMSPIMRQRGIHSSDDQNILIETFEVMRQLHDEKRNHIWGYYIRNLIRPLWLAMPHHRVDVLVGNPPWLRYSKMTAAMQARYKVLATERGLLSGGLGGSGRDLATLFVARAVELYLRPGGRFAFVMPHGTLSRRPHAPFRTGSWVKAVDVRVQFDTPWDLDRITTGFPMSSCVVRGHSARAATPMPSTASAWVGRLGYPDVSWEVARRDITTHETLISTLGADEASGSPYRAGFRQGAILVPRFLLFVNEAAQRNPLGAGAGRVEVESARSVQEKSPWKDLPSLRGTVESRFIRNVYLGESVAPFRSLGPRRAVLPLKANSILSTGEIEENPGLASWWADVEEIWSANRKPSETKPLLERFDYHSQLSAQLPAPAHRVLYTKAGNTLAACRLSDPSAIIDHKLYWAATATLAEARYLLAILNSEVLLSRVAPLQARGLFGARDFDKYVFDIPIPLYDPTDPLHVELASLAARAERVAEDVTIDATERFQTRRRRIRDALVDCGIASRIEAAVDAIIPSAV